MTAVHPKLSVSDESKTSIVVVNYNGGPLLADCIDTVRQNTSNYHIILVDNGSGDNSLGRIQAGPDLSIIPLSHNVGFARANNIGIRASRGQYVVLLNSDTRVTSSWLDNLVSIAQQSPDIGLVTPKLIRPGNPQILDSTGHIYDYQTGNYYDRGSGQVDRGQYELDTELLSSCFACTLIKREVFEDIGLLDEKMFFSSEDVDFGFRARISGWRVIYCPQSSVYHIRGGSTRGKRRERVLFQSKPYPLRIMLKNFQTAGLMLYGGRRVLLDLLRIGAGFKNQDWNYSIGYAFELSWNVIHPPIKQRMVVQRRRRVSDKAILASIANQIRATPRG